MEIVDAVDRMDDGRGPGSPGRQAPVEPGDAAVGMEDVDGVFLKDRGDGSGRREAGEFSEPDRNVTNPDLFELVDQRATLLGRNEDLELLFVQAPSQRQDGDLPPAEERPVDHFEDPDACHGRPPFAPRRASRNSLRSAAPSGSRPNAPLNDSPARESLR